jgi:ABC-type tungstate transport system permease subunit
MGAMLNVANGMSAHTLSDRASWLVGPKSAKLISTYQINGELLFTFNADAN